MPYLLDTFDFPRILELQSIPQLLENLTYQLPTFQLLILFLQSTAYRFRKVKLILQNLIQL